MGSITHVLVADADHLPFLQDSFDYVLCSFAIFLFSSLSGPVAESHRVLRSSGRIGLVYSAGEDTEWSWYEQLISRYRPTASLGTERYRPRDVEAALIGAGFMDVSATVEVHQLTFSNASEFGAGRDPMATERCSSRSPVAVQNSNAKCSSSLACVLVQTGFLSSICRGHAGYSAIAG